MKKTLKISDLIVVDDFNNLYEKQTEFFNTLKTSIETEGQKTPCVVNTKMELIDGYLRREVLLKLGTENIEVLIEDVEPTIEERIIRNSYRKKTDLDEVNEVTRILNSVTKKQGRKKKDEVGKTYVDTISTKLYNRWKDAESINKLKYVLDNDFKNKIVSKTVINNSTTLESGYNFLKIFKPLDEKNKYGLTKKVESGELTIKDGNKLIQKMDELSMGDQSTFIIPEKCYSYNIDCTEIGNYKEHLGKVDLIFSSPPYWELRHYDNNDKLGFGHEKTVEEYCENLTSLIKPVVKTLKETGSMMLNVGETYRNGVSQRVPFKLIDYVEKNTGLIFNEMLIWSKKNPKGNGGADDKNRPTTNVEYILWFVVNPEKTKYKKLTYKNGELKTVVSKGYKDVDKKGKQSPKGVQLTTGYKKIYNHIKEQEVLNVITTSCGRNHDVFKIYEGGGPAVMSELLPVCPILMTTDEGDLVYDFMSGTNVVGRMSHLLNRRTLSTELSKDYYSIGCKMLESGITDYNPLDLKVINKHVYDNENQLSVAA
jgi:DNA modification methylase